MHLQSSQPRIIVPLHERPLAFVDLETTGLDPVRDEILEIAVLLRFPNGSTTTWERRCLPKRIETASPKALEVNGYTPERWADAIPLHDALAQVVPLLEGSIWVGKNPSFDRNFLQHAVSEDWGLKEARHLPYQLIDITALAWEHLIPCGLTGLKLTDIARFLKIPVSKAHTAMGDVEMTATIYDKLLRATWFNRLYWKVLNWRFNRS